MLRYLTAGESHGRALVATIEGILGGIDDIAFAHLDAGDVVRHELVGRIVEAYDRHDATRPNRAGRRR